MGTVWLFGEKFWTWFSPLKKEEPKQSTNSLLIPTATAISGALGAATVAKMHYGKKLEIAEDRFETLETAANKRIRALSKLPISEETQSWIEHFWDEWGFLITIGMSIIGLFLLITSCLGCFSEPEEESRVRMLPPNPPERKHKPRKHRRKHKFRKHERNQPVQRDDFVDVSEMS